MNIIRYLSLFPLWLHWVFAAALELSLAVESGSAVQWLCVSFSWCRAQALGKPRTSVVEAHGLSS